MNARQNLYRQQHWQLAERQRYLAELESLAERLRVDTERMKGEIDQAGVTDETSRVHSVFVRPLIDRRDKLQRSVAEIDVQIAEARAAVAAAQQEMKLLEGPLAQRGFTLGDPRPTRRAPRAR
jgi:flagellar protein FliJ